MNIFNNNLNNNNNDNNSNKNSYSRFQVTTTNINIDDPNDFHSTIPFLNDNHNTNNNNGGTDGIGGGAGGTGSAGLMYDNDLTLNEPLFELEENNNNNNTVTTTSSSTNSFYNTIYKYRKLKQNNNNSFDNVFTPPLSSKRRLSFFPHSSVVGIPYYNERILVYNFLQRPTGVWAIGYHVFVSLAVIYCLILTVISTSSKYTESLDNALNTIDYLIVTFFIVEFIARIWSSECVSYYQGWKGKIRFFKNPIRIIDLCVIVVSLAVLISNMHGELLITSLRGVRFIQIFQMVRLDFKFRPWRMMASVVYSQRIHLAIVFYMGFLALIFISFVIYFVEKDANEDFDSLASSMWWAVITLCTIGYGDMYPKTSTGKLLACICSVIGVSIFALPAGILGTGLALKVQEQQRQLKISKRKQPAARLIQCAWKLYVAEQELLRASNNNENNVINNNNNNSTTQTQNCLRSVIWKRFDTNKNKSKTLTWKEINGLCFVFAVKFCISKRDFVKAFKPYDIKDVLEQYAAGHADMLAKIRLMDNRLERIQSNSITSKQQHEIRLRFLSHINRLELEMQKMQININDLMQYQINSRLIIENLLKYLLDQQCSLRFAHTNNDNNDCHYGNISINNNSYKCKICSKTNISKEKLLTKFHQLNFVDKFDQIFQTLNQDVLLHVLRNYFGNNDNNNEQCRCQPKLCSATKFPNKTTVNCSHNRRLSF